MYAGVTGQGYRIPTALGEAWWGSNYGGRYLGEVSAGGYGPYLGNIFDDISNIAAKVGVVSSQLAKVKAGKAKVAVVPTDRASLTIPIPGQPVGVSIPVLPLALGVGALAYLAFRRKRR